MQTETIPIWYYFSFTAHLIKTEFRPRLYLQDNSPFSQNRVQTQIIFVRQQSIFSKHSSDPDYICKTTVHLLKTEFRPRLYRQDNSPFSQNRVQTQIIFVRQQSIFSKQSSDPDYICKTTVHLLKTEFRSRLYLQDNSPFTQNRVQTQIIFARQQSIYSKQSSDPDYICKQKSNTGSIPFLN